MTVPRSNALEVPPEQAAELVRGGAQLVDVREPYEVEAGRLGGSRHVGLAELAAQAQTVDRDRPVVFYCRVGARSLMAANAFRQAGYEAYSIAGGMVEWV